MTSLDWFPSTTIRWLFAVAMIALFSCREASASRGNAPPRMLASRQTDLPASAMPAVAPQPVVIPTAPVAPAAPSVPAIPAAVEPQGSSSQRAPASQWPFLNYVTSHCYPDQLARTPYLHEWVAVGGLTIARDPGEPQPNLRVHHPRRTPEPGTAAFATAREALLRRWDQPTRQSHVLDCSLQIDHRHRGGWIGHASVPYVIYLPADYLDHPTAQRPVLLLFPGGRGDRTRWFLLPVGHHPTVPGTGGLAMRQRMDAWARSHQDSPTPIVLSIDGPNGLLLNGAETFIAQELPNHILETYLPHQTRAETAYGVESISAGSIYVLRAMHRDPSAFATVGLLGLFCHPGGLWPHSDFGSSPERHQFYRALAQRRSQGALDLRISVGRQDPYYGCNFELYRDLTMDGVFRRQEQPELSHCRGNPNARQTQGRCVAAWDGFFSYPGVGHNYTALVPSFPPALEWNLQSLVAIAQRRHGPIGN